jgi:hypothetical protein
VDRLIRLAVESGVGRVSGLSGFGALDAGWLHFSVLTEGGLIEADLDWGFTVDASTRTPDEQEAVRRLVGLRGMLLDLPGTLGADAGAEGPYEPHALAVVNQPWAYVSPGTGDRAWPGPSLPGQPTGWGYFCTDVTGADVAAVLEAAAPAKRSSPWVWAGQRYDVKLRPLLPDEASCADLRLHVGP